MDSSNETVRQLVTNGVLAAGDADLYLARGAEEERDPLALLIKDKVITGAQMYRAHADIHGWLYSDLSNIASVDPDVIKTLTNEQARRLQAVPYSDEDGRIHVAVSNPDNLDLLQELQGLIRTHSVVLAYAHERDVKRYLDRHYNATTDAAIKARQHIEGNSASVGQVAPGDMNLAGASDSAVSQIVDLLIEQAVASRASDVHIEPYETEVVVRYRIDGVLVPVGTQPQSLGNNISSRVKVLANLNIAEKRIPQDGRISQIVNGKKVDIRVSVMPGVWGEGVVMRILNNETAALPLTKLGFSDHNLSAFHEGFTKSNGLVLVTGPTGSGKSTTLYSALGQINNERIKTVTIEDPVEYRIPGITQVQVNVAQGLTFAKVLRSTLRFDPDVILIGEIRDSETAQIAIDSALTGHLVLSTLHTNDAPSAISRLTEMEVEPYLISSAIQAVLAQRLCRALCQDCKLPSTITEEMLARMGFVDINPDDLFDPNPDGCDSCNDIGYNGRIALHEVMTIDDDIRRLVVERASSTDLGHMARKNGMQPLKVDGGIKASQGITSIAEVLRVVA